MQVWVWVIHVNVTTSFGWSSSFYILSCIIALRPKWDVTEWTSECELFTVDITNTYIHMYIYFITTTYCNVVHCAYHSEYTLNQFKLSKLNQTSKYIWKFH